MKRTAYAVVLFFMVIQSLLPLVGTLLMIVMLHMGAPAVAFDIAFDLRKVDLGLLFGPGVIPVQVAIVFLLGRRVWLSVKARRFAVPVSLRSFAYGLALAVMWSAFLFIVALVLTLLLCKAGGCSGVPAGLVFIPGYALAPFVFLYCEIRSLFDRKAAPPQP